METPQRHPLFWPTGWPRAHSRHTAQFGTRVDRGKGYTENKRLSPGEAMDRLERELDALGASNPLLSTNIELNLRGQPRGDRGEPGDPGAAVFFAYKGKDVALACDKWDRVADNIAALAKHIEAMRGMDRWGVGTVEQLFTGYVALPAPEQWWNVLDCPRNASRAQVKSAYAHAAAFAHPDKGGSDAAMARVNGAKQAADADLDARGL